MWWKFGGSLYGYAAIVSQVMLFWAYDKVTVASLQDNSGSDATIQGYIDAAATIKSELELEMIQMTAFETVIGMALHEQEDNWLAAQLMTVHRNAMKNKAKKEE